ncbi:MAG: ATP synthase F1 subunit gamma [Planctomycetota bacterium]|nr:MAG: ATP synthase F1 subunit gamma [Planctomycetota bacterium]
MGNLRDIKRRIKSVQNTTKITRTMELIATAKSQACMNRIRGALPYFHALDEIAGQAQQAAGEGELEHPLLEQREVRRVAILVVVANRGLCGGYNTNCLRLARDHRERLLAEGKEVLLHPSGKKGINWLKFNRIPYEGDGYTQFEDKPAFAEVEAVADELIGAFLSGAVDRVDVVYTHYFSAGRQAPVVETVLPLAGLEGDADTASSEQSGGGARVANFIIEPNPRAILDTLFPLQAKLHLFRVYLEAATAEQIYRRVAMKNATDNGIEVGKTLKMDYNRARQSQITNEILEVLGGAEALA